jgi:hypothetical protein
MRVCVRRGAGLGLLDHLEGFVVGIVAEDGQPSVRRRTML